MDYTAVALAVVTGIFSIITLKMKHSETSMNGKLDEQRTFIEKEKEVRRYIIDAEKRRNQVIEQITMFLMKVNSYLLLSLQGADPKLIEDLQKTSMELEISYRETTEYLNNIYKEHELLVDMIDSLQSEINNLNKSNLNKTIEKIKDISPT